MKFNHSSRSEAYASFDGHSIEDFGFAHELQIKKSNHDIICRCKFRQFMNRRRMRLNYGVGYNDLNIFQDGTRSTKRLSTNTLPKKCQLLHIVLKWTDKNQFQTHFLYIIPFDNDNDDTRQSFLTSLDNFDDVGLVGCALFDFFKLPQTFFYSHSQIFGDPLISLIFFVILLKFSILIFQFFDFLFLYSYHDIFFFKIFFEEDVVYFIPLLYNN